MNVDLIRNALEYPGHLVHDSFLYSHNSVCKVIFYRDSIENSVVIHGDGSHKPLLNYFSSKSLVVSYGANAALKYLQSKFQNLDVTIPVLYTQLSGYDVVYSNYICSDGTVPATLIKDDKSSVFVFFSPITEEELSVLNETEAIGQDYRLVELEMCDLIPAFNERKVYYYECVHGPLIVDGKELACDFIRRNERIKQQLTQYEVQKTVFSTLQIEGGLYDFIDKNINDSEFRMSNNRRLRRHHEF